MTPKEAGNEDDQRRSEEWLKFHFASLRPPLAYLPHCLFRQGREALTAVLKAANAKGGIFGDHPRWDHDGRPYIGFGKEEFTLWQLPINQEHVLRYGAYAKLGQFTAVIDSRTPPALYWQMYSEAESPDAGISCYDWWIANIARWLPELRWAYIPLTEDSPFAMFVARESDGALVEAVKAELATQGIHCFELAVHGDTVSWPKGELGLENVSS
jgi:hypothetical protein